MPSFRLALFDLDGTLLGAGNQCVSSENVAALQHLRNAGISIGIATGRCLSAMRSVLEDIGPVACMVVDGGSLVLGPDGAAWSCASSLPSTTLSALLRLGEASGIPALVLVADGRILCEAVDNEVVKRISAALGLEDQLWPVGKLSEFALPEDLSVIRVHFETGSLAEAAALPQFREALQQSCPGTVVKANDVFSLDVHPAGISKASALDVLAKHLGVMPGEIIAFGDSENDIELLQAAGLGVAMGNASAEAKASADLIIGPHDTDAIACFLMNCEVDTEHKSLVYSATLQVDTIR